MKFIGHFNSIKTHQLVDTKEFEVDGVMSALIEMNRYASETNTYCGGYYKKDTKYE